MSARVQITLDGAVVEVPDGISVAAAIAHAGQTFRRSIGGDRRAPFCGMGVCFECRVCIDGKAHQRSCMVMVREGMQVCTDG
jgi:sarcosine oxidase subunit alpha